MHNYSLQGYEALFKRATEAPDTITVQVADVTTRTIKKATLGVNKDTSDKEYVRFYANSKQLLRLLGGDEHERISGTPVTIDRANIFYSEEKKGGLAAWFLTYEGLIPRIPGVSFVTERGERCFVGNVVFHTYCDVDGPEHSLYFVASLHETWPVKFQTTKKADELRNELHNTRLEALKEDNIKLNILELKAHEGKSRCVCGKAGTKRCGKCRVVFYCCRECQVADWRVHKEACIPC